MKGESDTAESRVQPVLDAVASVCSARIRSSRRAEFGEASADHALDETIGQGLLERGAAVGADHVPDPAARVRRVRRGGRAGAARVLGRARLARASSLVSHLLHASDATSSVILLIGMAVGVDYSLFYVKREREERAAGHDGAKPCIGRPPPRATPCSSRAPPC